MNFPTKILPSKSCWFKNFFAENPLPVRVEDNFFVKQKPRPEERDLLISYYGGGGGIRTHGGL